MSMECKVFDRLLLVSEVGCALCSAQAEVLEKTIHSRIVYFVHCSPALA